MLMQWPALRVMTPAVPVRVVHVDGQVRAWWWNHGALLVAQGEFPAHSAWAVEMPEDAVLERTLTLPQLSAADVAEAVALEADSISPFGSTQTVSGFALEPMAGKGQGSESSTQTVRMALTSKAQIEQLLQGAQSQLAGAVETVEVWVLPQNAQNSGGESGIPIYPIVFTSEGGQLRHKLIRQGRLQRLGLLALAVVLLAGLAATPMLQARERALQAQHSLSQLSAAAAPQQAMREDVLRQAEGLRVVQELMKTQLAPMPVLDLMTRLVPDSAWLSSVRIEGDKVVLTGNADDAAALVQMLSAEPGVRDVRLPSPATRPPGTEKERFTIELRLDTKAYGLASAKEGA